MSYLSRRMREIRDEEQARQHPTYDFVHDRWPQTAALSNPSVREPVSWRGRAG